MTETTYRIVGLEADNVKRLRAVSITPQGNVVEVTGRNRQGKSSLLDSIAMALGGKALCPPEPIRQGEANAHVSIDLGAFKVTRRWWRQEAGTVGTDLKVTTAEGFVAPKGQTMLDALVGELMFDPLDFAQACEHDPKRAVAMLQALVPTFDFAAADRANKEDETKRADAGRERDRVRAQADAIVVDENTPVEEVNEAALVQQLAQAGEEAQRIAGEQAARNSTAASVARMRQDALGRRATAGNLREQADQLLAQAAAAEEQADQLETNATQAQAALEALPALPAMPDTTALQQQIAQARQTNALVAQAGRKYELEQQADQLAAEWDAIQARIAERNAAKAAAIAAANLPVEGLDLGDSGVTLAGVPFVQASQAEQLEASLAIAVAMNPRLRVVRIKQGAFLDSDAWARLGAFAEKHDVQCWVETVSSGREGAVVIEDGEVLVTGQGSRLERTPVAEPPAPQQPREKHVAAAEAAAQAKEGAGQ